MKKIGHYIAGRPLASTARHKSVFNSYNGEVIAHVAMAGADEAKQAIEAAKSAFVAWSQTPVATRLRILFAYRSLLEEARERFAEILAVEHGKVFTDALGEIQRGIEVVEHMCSLPELLKSDFSQNVGTSVDTHVLKQPLGVCVGITPFNFPFMVPLWMFPVAIACGNTFVLKPSEQNPSCALLLAELFQQAGLPDGVFNVINGDQEAVKALLTSPDVAAASFVGSTAVAEQIYEVGCKNGKRVQALGGAKNHMVVMPDADIKEAANNLLGAAYGSAGERCMAISVAVAVGDETAEKLIAELKPAVEALKIGPGIKSGRNNDMGPLISQEHRERVLSYVDFGVQEGAELVVDGRSFKHSEYPGGYFVGGCLFDKVRKNMRIYQEEIFGPVLCIIRVGSLEESLELINQHPYGNGTSIFTRSGEAAHRFSTSVQCGMVGVNVPIPVPVAYHSFGGWKRSIFGHSNIYGPEGVRFYTKPKTITSRWQPTPDSIANFNFPVNH